MAERQRHRRRASKRAAEVCLIRSLRAPQGDHRHAHRTTTVQHPFQFSATGQIGRGLLLETCELIQHLLAPSDPSIQRDRRRKPRLTWLAAKPDHNATGGQQTQPPAGNMHHITDQPLSSKQTSSSQSQRPQQRRRWHHQVWP